MRIITLMVAVLFSCFCSTYKGNDNVNLSDFTQEVITLYLNDSLNIGIKNRNDDIILISSTDTSHFYLTLFSHDNNLFCHSQDDYVGICHYLGHKVKVFGQDSSMFYSLKNKVLSKNERYDSSFICEYDPIVWCVSFYRDTSFDKMRTHKNTAEEEISDIQAIAEKFHKKTTVIDTSVFRFSEVEEMAEISIGKDSLYKVIKANFNKGLIRSDKDLSRPIIVELLIDEDGKASVCGFAEKSANNQLNDESMRVANIISEYDFKPGYHRGQAVKTIYQVLFLKNALNDKYSGIE